MKVVVIGGGGHASVVIDAARANGTLDLVGVIDSDERKPAVLGLPIIGNDEDLPRLKREGIEGFIIGLGHSRSLALRAQLFQTAVTLGLVPVSIVHPNTSIAASARIGTGVVILAGAVVNAEAIVEDNVILNTAGVVEHHCRVGSHCHIAPGAVLCGNVTVEREVLIGARAVVREGLRIDAGATIGMGSVVVRDVPAGAVVAGNPARLLSGP